MALRRKVNDVVKVIFFKQAGNQVFIANIALYKDMACVTFDAFQVFQVSGIGQLVQVDQQDVLIFFQHIVNKVGTNKTGTASDQILLHTLFSPLPISVQHIQIFTIQNIFQIPAVLVLLQHFVDSQDMG